MKTPSSFRESRRAPARKKLAMSRSQWALRCAGCVIGLAGPVLVLVSAAAPAVATLAFMLLVAASLVTLRFPDLGFPAVIGGHGFFLLCAGEPAAGPWPLLLTLGALTQAVAVTVSATAPPAAQLATVVLRRWAARLGLLGGLAVVTAGLAALASRLTTLPDPVATSVALLALLGLAAGLAVFRPPRRRPDRATASS